MPRRAVVGVAAIIAAGGLAAGCGGSSSSSSTSSPTPAAAPASGSSSSGSSSGAQPAALIVTKKQTKLGTVLAYGPKKLTVYEFKADSGGKSSCTGTCAAAWPPVIGQPKAGSGAKASDLGTIKRSDGATQVTYKGHPLYTYVKDQDDGDAYGEGVKQFGAEWYALAPSGNDVDLS